MKSATKFLLPARQVLAGFLLSFLFATNTLAQVTVSGAITGNGSYADLSSAFSAINGGSQTGASIVVQITANTTETITAQLLPGNWTSFQVQSSGAFAVSGSLAAPLIDLNGASNVMFSGANSLTLANTSTSNTGACTIRFINGASGNTITACEIQGSSAATSLASIVFSTSTAGGNSNNLISSCVIRNTGSAHPVNAIYATGTSTAANTNNRIVDCEISDYYSPSLATAGILLAANSESWTVSGNRLFQTALRIYTTANTHRGILVSAGANHNITGNIIGYADASGTGKMMMTGTVATRYVGIEMSVATTSVSTVSGNTISAITLTSTSSTGTGFGVLCVIHVPAGKVNVSGNLIGATTGSGALECNITNAGGGFVGINSASTNTINISGNYIGSAYAASTAAIAASLLGINVSGISTAMSITSNTIGNTTANNLQAGTSGLTTGNSIFTAINFASTPSGTVHVHDNIIRNGASFGTGTSGVMRGIYTSGTSGSTTFSITGNIVSDLTTNNSNAAVANGQLGNVGIAITCGSQNKIRKNIVHNLSNTTTTTNAVNVGGISTAVSTDPVIEANVIYDLFNSGTGTSTTAPPMVFGIFIRGASGNADIRNNMISFGDNNPHNTAFAGIVAFGGGGAPTLTRVYYNTINITGTVTSGAHPTFGIFRGNFSGSITFPMDIKNNLVNNTRTGGTGSHFAIGNGYNVTAATAGWPANTSDFNILNAAASTVGHWTSAQTFSGWQNASSGDADSHTGVPVTFVNPVSDLHLNMGTTPTLIESGGTVLTSITTDFDNQSRPGPAGSVNGGGIAPDIGADEIDGSLLTCTNAVGGVINPASGSACAGQTVSATAQNASSMWGIVYQWQVSTNPGGPYADVSGGSGANTTSYTSAPLPAGTFYVVLKVTCTVVSVSAVSNEATLTVNPVPTAAASISTPTTCSGGTVTLNGSSNVTPSYAWTGPGGFISTSQNPVINDIPASGTGIYTLTTMQNGCASTEATVSLIVYQTPADYTVTPVTSTICSGGTTTLNSIGGDVSSILNFTPQANQNGTTTYPAVYSMYYGGQKTQFIILASELAAAGVMAGSLTAIQFPVISLGSNWGNTTTELMDFQVSIGHTNLNAFSGTFQGGLNVVASQTSFTPVVGYGNIHTFNTPFIWDGTSNIIVETVFSNNLVGTTSDAVIQYFSPTSFQSTLVYRADNTTFATMAAATSSNYATNFIRPDFKLHGKAQFPIVWSPATGLSSTSQLTVDASPTSSTIYTVSSNNMGCASNATAEVNVTPMPVLSINASTTTICEGDSVLLTASGAPTFTWSTQSQQNPVTVKPALTTVVTVSSSIAPCPVVTASETIVVNQLPPVAISPQPTSACLNSAITFTASGADTYIWNNTAITDTTSYVVNGNVIVSVAGTNSLGCMAFDSLLISALPLPTLNITQSSGSVCANSPLSMTVTGASSYLWNDGSTSDVLTLTPGLSGVYTATGTLPTGCSSTVSANVTVFSLPAVAITPVSQTVCAGEIASFTASGANTYSWIPGNSTDATYTVLTTNDNIFTVTGVDNNNCSNTATASLVMDPCTGIQEKAIAGLKIYPNPGNGLLLVETVPEGEKLIRVYSYAGSLISEIHFNGSHTQLDLRDQAKGIYLMQIEMQGMIQSFRLVIQ